MDSFKRELPRSDELQFKKARVSLHELCEYPPPESLRVTLNPADCDIDFDVEESGLKGSALHEEGFGYCWSGSRANIGIRGGKYCFGCKIVSDQPVVMEDSPQDQKHVCRIGISRGDDAVRNLGESMNSFGYGGTAKFSSSGKFFDYGEKFGVGDIIMCAVDLERKPMASVGFFKNGKWLGVAKMFDASLKGLGLMDSPIRKLPWEQAIFPHVLLKNTVVQLQFSIDDGLVLVEGYKPWAEAILDGNSVLGPVFSSQHNHEIIMMVGLPASGKTSWAENWVKEHPDKRYVILGTDLVLDQMKLPGLLRKRNYGERFKLLMDRATKIFNILLSRASKISRNYIVDQTNVYKSARRRKLKSFINYNKIAVVVFPRPEELKLRAQKQLKETGKEVPAEAVKEMLDNYTLPTCKDMPGDEYYFDQVLFVGLSREESQISLNEMKRNTSRRPCPGNSKHEAYFCQNQLGAPSEKRYSDPRSYDSRSDVDYLGSCSGYNFTNIDDCAYRMPPAYGCADYLVDDMYNRNKFGADFSRSNSAYSITTSLLQDPGYKRDILWTAGTLYDRPAMMNPIYLQASPSTYAGSNGFQMPMPPSTFQNFPTGMQHREAYLLASPPRPFQRNFHLDSQHPGVDPRPPQGY